MEREPKEPKETKFNPTNINIQEMYGECTYTLASYGDGGVPKNEFTKAHDLVAVKCECGKYFETLYHIESGNFENTTCGSCNEDESYYLD